MSKKLRIPFILFLLFGIFLFPWEHNEVSAQNGNSDKEFMIILTVYAGRPNPTWKVTKSSEFDRIEHLLNSLEVKQEKLFDYQKWNRLGYASFLVIPKGMADMPERVHIWRDMAYFEGKKGDEQPRYAVGATDLYDVLIKIAEKDDFGYFFKAYKTEKKQAQ